MAALSAILTTRKALGQAAEPAAAKGPGAELNQKGGTGTGPAAGSGFEIILQVCPGSLLLPSPVPVARARARAALPASRRAGL